MITAIILTTILALTLHLILALAITADMTIMVMAQLIQVTYMVVAAGITAEDIPVGVMEAVAQA
jgi:hypothetical protein